LGMVMSAFEFLQIAEDLNYYNIVLSMKASNPQVMVQAYRLLVNKMMETGRNYPLHLGVTEAGDGEDGRIKSAIGIGALLEDGLGDTIRVSLTEDPEFEIPVCKLLAKRYSDKRTTPQLPRLSESPVDPLTYSKREVISIHNIGFHHVPVVVSDFSFEKNISASSFVAAGYRYDAVSGKWNIADAASDYIYVGHHELDFEIPGTPGIIQNYPTWNKNRNKNQHYPLLNAHEYFEHTSFGRLHFVHLTLYDLTDELCDKLQKDAHAVVVLSTGHFNGMQEQRLVFFQLIKDFIKNPIIIHRTFENLNPDELTLYSSTDFGALLLDGLGNGIWLTAREHLQNKITTLSFGILQGTRQRI
jgi:(E)-4-hydroxy-3-methylbut-2-enyl-diphosphate synthase